MNGPQKTWKRRNYLVNPGFQLRFMAYIGVGMLLGFAVIYITNLWYLQVLTADGVELGLNPEHVYFEYIAEQRSLMNRTFIGICSVVFLTLMVAGLLLSHKIAGPVYRVQKYTREVVEGQTPGYRVSLRKGDFFPELADIINDLVEHAQHETRQQCAAEPAPPQSAAG